MKRLITFISMAALLIAGAAQLHAQNRFVLKNDKGVEKTVTCPNNMSVVQLNDGAAMLIANKQVKSQMRSSSPTHTLSIYPPEDCEWHNIYVSDGEEILGYLYDYMGDFLSVELEEGVYHVMSYGDLDEGGSDPLSCIWTLDNIELTNDTEIVIDYHDCTHAVNLYAEDENGNPLSDVNCIFVYYNVTFIWHDIAWAMCEAVTSTFVDQVPFVRFNDFDGDNSLFINVLFDTGEQTTYFIACPDIKMMNESLFIAYSADDMYVTKEMFHVREDTEPYYYHTDIRRVLNDSGLYLMLEDFRPDMLFDPSKPYTVVSNAIYSDMGGFGPNDVQTFILPTVYEWYDFYGDDWPEYVDRIGTSLYFDGHGGVVREAMPYFREGYRLSSWPNCFPETPARIIAPADKTAYFGQRTALASYFPVAYNENNTPLHNSFFSGGFFFSGENSSERTCDYDALIRVCVDGQEMYYDSVFRFNYYYEFGYGSFQITPAPVVVEVMNDHLQVNGVPKVNQTRVEFDLNRNDAMPPTMTFLRVLDGDGDETVCLDDLSQSTVVFGAADFSYLFVNDEEGGYYDHLEYNAKPEVEVLYCSEGGDWQPLVIAEDVSLFHINYGNVFVADLSQLEGRALNKWVSLKFMLEDAAGNTQEQTLENVFYSGHTISVDEYAAERLEHEVIPNPFTEEVRIKSAQSLDGAARVQLYDVLGRRVYDATENGHAVNEFIIDGSALKPGIYFYSINTENGLMQGRIVKE